MTKRSGAAHVQRWWGDFEVPDGRILYWQVGPLALWVQRDGSEWRVSRLSRLEGTGTEPSGCIVAAPSSLESIDAAARVDRYAVGGGSGSGSGSGSIELAVASADRPVVSSVEEPFHVAAGAQVDIFVGSPLWVQVAVTKPHRTLLFDAPVQRPSDTWFGPPTHEGELCYASRTHGRSSVDEVPWLPHRALTALHLRNRGEESLRIERLKLPVDALDLYASADGRIWTQDVTLESHGAGAAVHLTIGRAAPRAAKGAERLCDARRAELRSAVVRAFGTLFSS